MSSATPGMWQMVSDLLDGEKLPVSINRDLADLCNGKAIVVRYASLDDPFAQINALKHELQKCRERRS